MSDLFTGTATPEMQKERLKYTLRLTRDLREAQRTYFRFRRFDDLQRSKVLERQVDEQIQQLQNAGLI